MSFSSRTFNFLLQNRLKRLERFPTLQIDQNRGSMISPWGLGERGEGGDQNGSQPPATPAPQHTSSFRTAISCSAFRCCAFASQASAVIRARSSSNSPPGQRGTQVGWGVWGGPLATPHKPLGWVRFHPGGQSNAMAPRDWGGGPKEPVGVMSHEGGGVQKKQYLFLPSWACHPFPKSSC